MTLVVGTIDTCGVQIVADTRISRQYDPSNVSDVLTGALKVMVLHPNLAVSFSGDDSDAATEAILDLPVTPGAPFNLGEVLTLLQRRSLSARVEFLVAVASPPSLTRIDGDHRSTGEPIEHLGEGFGLYQRNFLSPENAKMVEGIPNQMLRAMIRVVADGSCRSVGGTAVAVHTTSSGFNYFGGQGKVAGLAQATVDPATNSLKIGTSVGVPQGSYTETVLAPRRPGVTALGIHLAEIGRGALLAPRQSGSRHATQFKECTAIQLRDMVAARHNIDLVLPTGDLAVYF